MELLRVFGGLFVMLFCVAKIACSRCYVCHSTVNFSDYEYKSDWPLWTEIALFAAMSASNRKKLRENDDFIVIKLVCLARGYGWGDINNRWNGADTVRNEGIFNVHCEQVATPLWKISGKLKFWENDVCSLTVNFVLKILFRTISANFPTWPQ